MKERLRNFLQGRNGYDQFSRFMMWVSIALLLISMFTGRLLGGVPSRILWALAIAAIVYSYFRVFSKSIYKRQAENGKYMAAAGKVRNWFRGLKRRWCDRKTYKYFRCPSCKAQMRVPKGKGKIRITCKSCGKQFEARS